MPGSKGWRAIEDPGLRPAGLQGITNPRCDGAIALPRVAHIDTCLAPADEPFRDGDAGVLYALEARMNGPRTRLAAVVLLLGPVACSSTSASGGSPPTADSTVAPGPKCAAAPKQVLTENDSFVPDASGAGISAGMDIAVSATDLYVGVTYGFASSAILRTPIRGGAPVVVAAIPAAEQGFVLTGDSLVFAQANQPASGADGAIVKIGLHDGTRTVLASASIDMGSNLRAERHPRHRRNGHLLRRE